MDRFNFGKYYITVHDLQEGNNFLLTFMGTTPILVVINELTDIFSALGDISQVNKIFVDRDKATKNIFSAMVRWPDENYTYHINELESHVVRSMHTKSYT